MCLRRPIIVIRFFRRIKIFSVINSFRGTARLDIPTPPRIVPKLSCQFPDEDWIPVRLGVFKEFFFRDRLLAAEEIFETRPLNLRLLDALAAEIVDNGSRAELWLLRLLDDLLHL